jgi:hypothetical protein
MGMGTLQISGLLCESYTMRRFAAMVALMVWLFVGVCIAHDEWRAMACPTALACAIGAGLGFVKIGQSRILGETEKVPVESTNGKPD